MRYSKVFGKTSKTVPNDIKMVSHRLLMQAGFIRESTAGRYFFLPLGWRVHDKIKAVIKSEMDKAGAQEMITPVLHPLELWQETNRTNTAGFELMKIKDRRGAEFALGGTAEEMFTDVVRGEHLSYKDLPFNVYQFSTKFRDELRARGGLLRVREFVMKDAYSFHRDETDFKKEYQKMAETYTNIFRRVGLETWKVEADNGYIGGEYCHEYQVEHADGEGRFFVSEDGKYFAHEDVAKFEVDPVNMDEAEIEITTIEQPAWVQSMDDNMKHYGKGKGHFLKNVVYRNIQGDIIIATIRGDLEVNKTKLEHVVNMVGQLDDATPEDLEAIGTKTGYVHSWGHNFLKTRTSLDCSRECKVIYVADNSLKLVHNFIGGQKQETTDTINVNYGRDFKHEFEGDIALAQEGMQSLDGHGVLHEKRGIEVGNIFQLGYHYSSLMHDASYIDEDGKPKPYYMGCYGIGLGRTLATIVEKFSDEKGIRWPMAVAPYQVHLIVLGRDGDASLAKAEEVYQSLQNEGIEVLFDDRQESAGSKFADADLIGIPIRVVISMRGLEKGEAEVKLRSAEAPEMFKLEGLELEIDKLIQKLKG